MTNLGEHEKILTQIAELEKTGVNYFDVEKEFFLIDSDNLDTAVRIFDSGNGHLRRRQFD